MATISDHLRPRSRAEALLLDIVRGAGGPGAEQRLDLGGLAEDDLLDLLARHRLLPLGGAALLSAAPEPALSAAAARRLEYRLRHSQQLADLQELLGTGILSELTRQGIRATWLKGPWLAARAFGASRLRESGDIDILVDRTDLGDAVAVVTQLGWQPPADWTDDRGRPLLHYALGHPKRLPPVEIHWRVHWYEDRFASEALARGDQRRDGVRMLPDDVFVFLLLFFARDGLSGLRLAADIIGWSRRHPPDPDHLAQVVRDHPALRPSLAAAAWLVERIAGRPVAPALSRLAHGRAVHASLRVADPFLRMDSRQLLAHRGLVDVLLAPAGERWPVTRRNLFTPWGILTRQRPELSGEPPGRLALASAEHAARTLRRLLLVPTAVRAANRRPG